MYIKLLRLKFSYVFFLFFISHSVIAQIETPIGNFTAEDINLKECSFDKEADAVIIYDMAVSNFNDEYNLITNHRMKFKILKEKGIDKGNIKIRYYSEGDFEFISNIEASILSYGDNKEAVKTNLQPKNIYKKKLNKYYSEISFAMPNVKVGSIIEYAYTSTMKHYGGLEDWYFQKEIPVMLSSYKLYIVPNAEFAYSVYKSDQFPIIIKPDKSLGNIYYEMNNIPGLRDEVYMGAARDYLQRVNFQLAGINRYGMQAKYTTTWKQLAQELLTEKYFGGQINKELPGVAKELWMLKTSAFEKMKTIHNYVRSTMGWNFIYSRYSESIKDAWEKKQGTGGDINLILLNLLKDAGLDVYPLLVSERDNGKVDTVYPFQDQFNKVVACVLIGDRQYILDGTDKGTPSHLTPYNLLNTKGFLIDRKNSRFIFINESKARDLNIISITGSLDNTGTFKGWSTVNNYDYAKINKTGAYISGKTKYQEDFVKPYMGFAIDSFRVVGLNSDSLPIKHEFNLEFGLNKSGEYFLLPYNLFTGLITNPFISGNRFSVINFGALYTCILRANYTLPDNLQLESLPQSIKLVTPDNSMVAYREVKKNENTIDVNIRIEINKSEYDADVYDMVKGFYGKLVEALNEPILLKSK